MHKNNPHIGRYNLQELIKSNPALAPYVHINQYEKETIDFHDPDAVKALNQSLLRKHYDIVHWDIPQGYLCPPIPGRADYIYHIADLLADGNNKIPTGSKINIVDIGVGSNCIYPLIGHKIFGWSFVGTDIDEKAIKNANKIITDNKLKEAITLRHQTNVNDILYGIIHDSEVYDVLICNPPFHESAEAAKKASNRKSKNLVNKKNQKLNFGGQSNELWYDGGELNFISKLIKESRAHSRHVYWYTTLISKESNLGKIKSLLSRESPAEYKVIEMTQGNKTSRFIAWTFLLTKTRKVWEEARWKD